MIPKTRLPFAARLAALLVLLASTSLLSGAVAAAAVAPIVYQDESYPTYQQQLDGGQIQSVTINKRLRSLRITLKDGRHVLAKYPRKQEPQTAATLAAKHVPVTVLSLRAAEHEIPKKATHHKLRYIAGAIVIVVILIAGAVLLITRKRRRDLE